MSSHPDHLASLHSMPGARLLANRAEAGALLAERLEAYRDKRALVLALPRGGVPVASQVASHLHADLDVVSARKLGAPGQGELAIGAITADGTRYVNAELVKMLGVSRAELDAVSAREQATAQRRERRFRAGLAPLSIDDRIVIIVDDGLATGATMRAAIASLRRGRPRKIVAAVPVGATQSCKEIDADVDELVCLYRAEPFHYVGMYYRDFREVSDDEVAAILHEHRSPLTFEQSFGRPRRRH